MGLKEEQIREDVGRASVWIENLLQGVDKNYLVTEPDYLTPTVDRNVILEIDSPQGLYEHFKKIYLDLIGTWGRDSSQD